MERRSFFCLAVLAGLFALAGWGGRPASADVPGWDQTTFGDTRQGSATIDANGVITVKGAGADTWEREDEFHILYKRLQGDGSITTKMLSAEEGHGAKKIGLMVRNDLTDTAAAVMEFDMSGGGAESIFRNISGGRMTEDQRSSKEDWRLFPDEFPVWMKIERRGNLFTPYASEDGVFWVPVTRAQRITMQPETIAGLFVMSHVDDELLTGTFESKASDVSSTLLTPEQAAPLQPDPVVALGGNNSVLLIWERVNHLGKEADGYNVYRKMEGEDDFTRIAELAADKTSFLDEQIQNGSQAQYRVTTVVKIGDKVLESRDFRDGDSLYQVTGTPQAPIRIGDRQYNASILDGGAPSPDTSMVGSASIDGNLVVTLRASGWDIAERSDGGQQLLTPVSGDFTLTARVLGPPTVEGGEVNEGAKFGIAVRESTLADSRYAAMLVTPKHGIRSPHRRIFNSGFSEDLGPNEETPAYPLLLRIQRRGDELRMFTSTDGQTFREYGSPPTTVLPNLPANVYVGLIGTSHDNDQIAQAQFDRIELITP
jgi:hypothetical protein